MRIGRIIPGVLTLLWGFLQGPFDHIHPGEDIDHEAVSAPVHLHMHETGHGWGVTAYTAPDDDEIDVLWTAATSAHVALPSDAEPAVRVFIPAPSAVSAAILIPRHRGHDPPESSPKIPRAPPA